jgi:hypothetical protein
MSNLHRGHSIDASYQVSVNLAKPNWVKKENKNLVKKSLAIN